MKTWEQMLDEVDGRVYELDGVEGTIKVETWAGRRTVHHEATAEGKESPTYLATKAELHDDWETELTWSERLPEIMAELGICT